MSLLLLACCQSIEPERGLRMEEGREEELPRPRQLGAMLVMDFCFRLVPFASLKPTEAETELLARGLGI